jgi:hypothetical protein
MSALRSIHLSSPPRPHERCLNINLHFPSNTVCASSAVVEKQKIGIYGEKGTVCVGTWQLFEGSAGCFGQVCCATSSTGLLDQTMLVEGGTSEEPWR